MLFMIAAKDTTAPNDAWGGQPQDISRVKSPVLDDPVVARVASIKDSIIPYSSVLDPLLVVLPKGKLEVRTFLWPDVETHDAHLARSLRLLRWSRHVRLLRSSAGLHLRQNLTARYRLAFRRWSCHLDEMLSDLWRSWSGSSLAIAWSRHCHDDEILQERKREHEHDVVATYAYCLSGQAQRTNSLLLARQVCAASLSQHVMNDTVDIFAFVSLGPSRCGPCHHQKCHDQGLGDCIEHLQNGERPPDAMDSSARGVSKNYWKRLLQDAIEMCPGSQYGAVDIAEDWEFNASEYTIARRYGMTQPGFAIQVWGIRQCFGLVEESERNSGVRYEAVMRARLDTFWFAPLPPYAPLLKPGNILVRSVSSADIFSNTNDQFAVVPRVHADAYFISWLAQLANDTFMHSVFERVSRRWNKNLGCESALMLTMEERGKPLDTSAAFPFAVFRPKGQCFVFGQPPGHEAVCQRLILGGIARDGADRRPASGISSIAAVFPIYHQCLRHMCCNSIGHCHNEDSASLFSCKCTPLPSSDVSNFALWIAASYSALIKHNQRSRSLSRQVVGADGLEGFIRVPGSHRATPEGTQSPDPRSLVPVIATGALIHQL